MSAVQGRIGHGNADGDAPVKIGGKANASAPDDVSEDDRVNASYTLDGKLRTHSEIGDGSGNVVSFIEQSTPFTRVSTADTNAAVVKNAAGKVHSIQVTSVNAAVRYLKLYDKATAPTVGTDVPVKTLVIPGGATGAGASYVFAVPVGFSAGISIALTTEATVAGTTGVSVSEHVVNIDYS